ncbi:hematopoietic progenitor cell antigen CD34 isoform X2 [Ochotona princeps]|uniref:hematopoietic progenitor cell antigen CD34 isoform X2 n=1 Tax=Ochotona princeps TaxID=9978 RepID=UPI0027150C61|nr:hematopoietic progenitor cell antigen CD34 isoform X2 [Ochotona princeps]
MLVRRGARAGTGMPRGWTALCLLSLLTSVVTSEDNFTRTTLESSALGTFSAVTSSVSFQEISGPSTPGSASPSPVSQDVSETTAIISETTVNLTSTSGVPPSPGTTNTSTLSQTSLGITVPTSSVIFSTSEPTVVPNTSPGNISDLSLNSTSYVTYTAMPYVSSAATPSTIKGEIRCSGIREVRLTQAICLELNETSSCEEFKKDKGEELTQVLCEKEQADLEAGARVCSLLLAQSEIRSQCLLLVLANSTELSSMLQFMKTHQSDLKKLGIQNFTEQDVASHQSYSRKTLIALVTSGVLLAVLGTTGYFLMNRRSWSPTGERLELEP